MNTGKSLRKTGIFPSGKIPSCPHNALLEILSRNHARVVPDGFLRDLPVSMPYNFNKLKKKGGTPIIILLYYLALDDQDKSFIASIELGYANYRFISALYSQNCFNKGDICFTF